MSAASPSIWAPVHRRRPTFDQRSVKSELKEAGTSAALFHAKRLIFGSWPWVWISNIYWASIPESAETIFRFVKSTHLSLPQ
jgi:hypothetical protein